MQLDAPPKTIASLSTYELRVVTAYLDAAQTMKLYICGCRTLAGKLSNGGVLGLTILNSVKIASFSTSVLQIFRELQTWKVRSPRWLRIDLHVNWQTLPNTLTKIDLTRATAPTEPLDFAAILPHLQCLFIHHEPMEHYTTSLPKGLQTLSGSFEGPLLNALPFQLMNLQIQKYDKQITDYSGILPQLTQLEKLRLDDVVLGNPAIPPSLRYLDLGMQAQRDDSFIWRHLPQDLTSLKFKGQDLTADLFGLLPRGLKSLVVSNFDMDANMVRLFPPDLTVLGDGFTRIRSEACPLLPRSLKKIGIRIVPTGSDPFNFDETFTHLEDLKLYFDQISPEAYTERAGVEVQNHTHEAHHHTHGAHETHAKQAAWLPPMLQALSVARLRATPENAPPGPPHDPHLHRQSLPPNLTHLHVSEASELFDLAYISQLSRSLTHLHAPIDFAPPETWSALPRHLSYFYIQRGSLKIVLAASDSCHLPPGLSTLGINGNNITVETSFLATLPSSQMSSLRVHGTMYPSDSSVFKVLPRSLTSLTIEIDGLLKDSDLESLPPSLVELSIELLDGADSRLTKAYPSKLPASLRSWIMPAVTDGSGYTNGGLDRANTPVWSDLLRKRPK